MTRTPLWRRWLVVPVACLVTLGFAPHAGSARSSQDEVQTRIEHLKTLAKVGERYQDTFGPDGVRSLSPGNRMLISLAELGDARLDRLARGGEPPPPALGVQPLQSGSHANDVNAAEDFLSRVAGSTQSQPSVAWCGQHAVIGFNDAGSAVATASQGSGETVSFNGWARSTNAGGGYTDRGILRPGTLPPGVVYRDLLGDPVLGCTSAQNFYQATQMLDTTDPETGAGLSAIGILRSTDGGATFGPAVTAASGPSDSHALQKPWLAVEPGPTAAASDDVLHVAYTRLAATGAAPCPDEPGFFIEYVRSTDGGQTWSTPQLIDAVCASAGSNVGPRVEFGLNDDVYVAWERFPATQGATRTILISRSTDLGASFGAAVSVATVTPVGTGEQGGREVTGGFSTFADLQGLAVDRGSGSRRGTVYLTFQSGHQRQQPDPNGFCTGTQTYCFGDAFVTTSTTNGATWSSPVRIHPADQQQSPVDQFQPTVAVDSSGAAWALWYDRRRDNRNVLIDAFVGRSTNGGGTWTNTQATAVNFAPVPGWHDRILGGPAVGLPGAVYMGDHIAITADSTGQNSGVIASWGDNALGDPNVAHRKFS